MKKLLLTLLLLSSFSFIGSSNIASAAVPAVGTPQVRIQIGQRRRRNRDWPRGERIGYGRTFTRTVQRGWHLYRETYQVRYLPNGMTQTVLISRVRIR